MAEEKIAVGEDPKIPPPEEPKTPEPKVPEPKTQEEDPEVVKKREQLANLNAAIATEQDRLKTIRKAQKDAKAGVVVNPEDEIPKINDEDPSAKAWTNRIKEAVAPAQADLERAKEERRLFTLRTFLADKPHLAKNPEKIKAMMETYDRLKTSTELTNEGIMFDLEKAYAAEHADELISAARGTRVEDARNNAILSDIGVTRGSTAYSSNEKPKPRAYTEDEKAQLAKWGMTPAEHAAMVTEQEKKA